MDVILTTVINCTTFKPFSVFFVWILSVLYFEIWEFIFEFSIYVSSGSLRGLSKYLYSVDSLGSWNKISQTKM